jgi:predicted transcriptional regulator
VHSLKEVLNRIDLLRGDVKSLRRLLTQNAPPLPFTSQTLLRLHLTQIRVLVALHSMDRQTLHSASEVAEFLGIKRAVASKALNELHRMGIITKSRIHRTVVFKLADSLPSKCQEKKGFRGRHLHYGYALCMLEKKNGD